MAKTEETGYKAKSIRLPKELWEALEADAGRCVRSDNGQIQAILTVYYQMGDVELSELNSTRSQVSPHLNYDHISIPMKKPTNALPPPVSRKKARG